MTREEEIQKAWDRYRRSFHRIWHTLSNEFIEGFKAGKKIAYEHPTKKQTVTIDGWVARDKNKVIGFYREKPNKMEDFYIGGFVCCLPHDYFHSITFENSPKKVKVTIELEED